ncbi:MAG: hypothetical protein EOO41_04365 [Methanobacteriota archaeon]|nr:MAG: hypothetical protein EOO41_04365 [Euryarchaeota archaeon]
MPTLPPPPASLPKSPAVPAPPASKPVPTTSSLGLPTSGSFVAPTTVAAELRETQGEAHAPTCLQEEEQQEAVDASLPSDARSSASAPCMGAPKTDVPQSQSPKPPLPSLPLPPPSQPRVASPSPSASAGLALAADKESAPSQEAEVASPASQQCVASLPAVPLPSPAPQPLLLASSAPARSPAATTPTPSPPLPAATQAQGETGQRIVHADAMLVQARQLASLLHSMNTRSGGGRPGGATSFIVPASPAAPPAAGVSPRPAVAVSDGLRAPLGGPTAAGSGVAALPRLPPAQSRGQQAQRVALPLARSGAAQGGSGTSTPSPPATSAASSPAASRAASPS